KKRTDNHRRRRPRCAHISAETHQGEVTSLVRRCHPERSEAEPGNPVELQKGSATGFLDFARNDWIITSSSTPAPPQSFRSLRFESSARERVRIYSNAGWAILFPFLCIPRSSLIRLLRNENKPPEWSGPVGCIRKNHHRPSLDRRS